MVPFLLALSLLQGADAAIDRLGDDSPHVRDEAEQELFSLGAEALPAIRPALKHSDPEVRTRARRLYRSARLCSLLGRENAGRFLAADGLLNRLGAVDGVWDDLKGEDRAWLVDWMISKERRGILPPLEALEPGIAAFIFGRILRYPDRKLRLAALREVPLEMEEHDPAEVLRLTSDRDPEIRAEATRVGAEWLLERLGALGGEYQRLLADRVGPISRGLFDSSWWVVVAAIRGSVELEWKGDAERIVALCRHRHWSVRDAAHEAVRELELNAEPSVLEAGLRDPHPKVRRRAVETAVDYDRRQLAPVLLGLLDDPDRQVSREAASALGRWATGDSALAHRLVRRLVERDDLELRGIGFNLLREIEPGERVKLFAGFVADPDARLRREAVRGLVNLEARREAVKIVPLLGDPSPGVRGDAAAALGRLGGPTYLRDIAPLLDDPEPLVRRNAIYAMGDMNATTFAPKLIRMIAAEDRVQRWSCVHALGAMKGIDVGEVVALLENKDDDVRSAALEILVSQPSADHTEALRRLVMDPNAEIRASAVLALGGTDTPALVKRVRFLLSDPDPDVRISVARILRTCGDDRILPNLRKAREVEKKHRVRVWLSAAIQEIERRDRAARK